MKCAHTFDCFAIGIADINNERDTKNQSYFGNLASLNKYVMVSSGTALL